MSDLAKMVWDVGTAAMTVQAEAGQPTVAAIAWTNGDRPESVRLVCIGWIGRDNLEDYQADPANVTPPFLWRKKCRVADMPVYVIREDDA